MRNLSLLCRSLTLSLIITLCAFSSAASGRKNHPEPPHHHHQHGRPTPPPPAPAPMPIMTMNSTDFNTLVKTVKRRHFTDEQLDIIRIGALGPTLSCAQVLQLMNLYRFDDDRMKVLQILAPRIADPANGPIIVNSFTFDNARSKAAKLILRH